MFASVIPIFLLSTPVIPLTLIVHAVGLDGLAGMVRGQGAWDRVERRERFQPETGGCTKNEAVIGDGAESEVVVTDLGRGESERVEGKLSASRVFPPTAVEHCVKIKQKRG